MKVNTVRLRVLLGVLGVLLPIIVAVLYGGLPASISATYYHAQCITPFMIVLGASSILLISYRGYTWVDDLILTCAGIAGLGICLFPTYATGVILVGTFAVPVALSSTLHNVFAIVFFALLSFNSLFLFTKSSGEMTKKKKARNVIYRVCGIGMLASFGIMFLPSFSCQVWLMEAAALFFFGVSFLTKADAFPFLFCDTKYNEADD